MIPRFRFASYRFVPVVLTAACLIMVFILPSNAVRAQEFTPEMLKAASQQTGLSEEELLRRYQQKNVGAEAVELRKNRGCE